jgi:hypothetical protein
MIITITMKMMLVLEEEGEDVGGGGNKTGKGVLDILYVREFYI